MDDLDEVRKRMQKRRGVKKPLNDDNFKRFYNFMVKFMVVIVVALVSLSYVKLNPNSSIKEMVLNDANYKAVTSWISDTLFSFLPDEDVSVSSAVTYQNISGDYFKNNSNEVLSITDGRVIETGIDDGSGSYVTVLGKDEVEITYGNIDNVMVALYDEVAQGMILGSYQEQLILKFEYLGEEITYEEYQRME
ncbi:MAG TPA: M23 family metallopeptidase [Candidatus Erysipelatoclostridium merdavium]|uniref:M23 family metallopeptidase n=1 Tax=Candidatus Erysipelatoclostridium merdavium TaxID=2838566 RepID=A0A9D2BN23_9FIRM|nr:M23 family metallopeptidase [uncultured Thomasclavelia sp.]HIX82063.1 M23 family metallopeptidase [Candidatus Erysipelatoclostridium merdavium]